MPKKSKTKPAAKAAPKPDIVRQTELRAVVELHDIAQDCAVEIRRRIENGAQIQKGRYSAQARGGAPIAAERAHRERCEGTSLCGLEIEYSAEAAHA